MTRRLCIFLLPFMLFTLAAPATGPATKPVRDAKGIAAMKAALAQGQFAAAQKMGAYLAWDDIYQPEALRCLAESTAKLKDPEQAAAFAHILLQVLDDPRFKDFAEAGQYRAWCKAQLPTLDAEFLKDQKKYLAAATQPRGRAFVAAEQVDDLWMTQITFTPHPLHGLYMWRLVGGRGDLPETWLHNAKGTIHQSGGKYFDEVDGRKGVLFAIPNKKSQKVSVATLRNVAKGNFLRIGVKGYNWPFVLNVVVEGKEIFTQKIEKTAWEDLKIPLGEAAGKDVAVTLELVVPEDQKWYEAALLDYVDFFSN